MDTDVTKKITKKQEILKKRSPRKYEQNYTIDLKGPVFCHLLCKNSEKMLFVLFWLRKTCNDSGGLPSVHHLLPGVPVHGAGADWQVDARRGRAGHVLHALAPTPQPGRRDPVRASVPSALPGPAARWAGVTNATQERQRQCLVSG